MSISHFLLSLRNAARSSSSSVSDSLPELQFAGPNQLGGSLVFSEGDEYLDDAEEIEDGVVEEISEGEGVHNKLTTDPQDVTSQGSASGHTWSIAV